MIIYDNLYYRVPSVFYTGKNGFLWKGF